MKNIRFKDDEKLSETYEKVNLASFRNYVYDFDGLGTYCNYLDEYECAIDDRDDKIEKHKETIDKAIKYIKERFYFNEETGEYALLHTFDKCNIKELLDILKVEE